MAFASPAVGPRRALPLQRGAVTPAPDPSPRGESLDPAEALRDELTQGRLVEAVAHLPGLRVLAYAARWWDGQTHVPCLIVQGGRRTRRLRVVETAGECVVVPFTRRTAERWLAARRRPGRPELGLPTQRGGADVTVDATFDTLRCTAASCGALLPLGYEGGCPVCGGA